MLAITLINLTKIRKTTFLLTKPICVTALTQDFAWNYLHQMDFLSARGADAHIRRSVQAVVACEQLYIAES